MSSLPPVDHAGMGDKLRNFFYPTTIFSAIAIVWLIGWATSVESKASNGYWSAINTPSANHRKPTLADPTGDPEHDSALASFRDDHD